MFQHDETLLLVTRARGASIVNIGGVSAEGLTACDIIQIIVGDSAIGLLRPVCELESDPPKTTRNRSAGSAGLL